MEQTLVKISTEKEDSYLICLININGIDLQMSKIFPKNLKMVTPNEYLAMTKLYAILTIEIITAIKENIKTNAKPSILTIKTHPLRLYKSMG